MTIANLTGTLGQTGVTQARHMTVFEGMRDGVSGCAVTATGVARQVSVGTGTVYFPGGSVDITAAHADSTTTATAQPSAGVRIDTLVMRVDTSANPVTAALAWVAGTASTGVPTAPSLTRTKGGTWEVPLADARLVQDQGVFTAAALTDRRLTPVGLVFSAASTTALRTAAPGSLCTVDGTTYSCGVDGATWTPVTQQQSLMSYTPVIGGITGSSLVRTGRWYRDGPAAHVHGRVAAAGTTALTAGGQVTATLPVVHGTAAFRAMGHAVWYDGSGQSNKVCDFVVEPGGSTGRVMPHVANSAGVARLLHPADSGLLWSAGTGTYFDFNVTVYP